MIEEQQTTTMARTDICFANILLGIRLVQPCCLLFFEKVKNTIRTKFECAFELYSNCNIGQMEPSLKGEVE